MGTARRAARPLGIVRAAISSLVPSRLAALRRKHQVLRAVGQFLLEDRGVRVGELKQPKPDDIRTALKPLARSRCSTRRCSLAISSATSTHRLANPGVSNLTPAWGPMVLASSSVAKRIQATHRRFISSRISGSSLQSICLFLPIRARPFPGPSISRILRRSS